jgi:dsRNA-specific ribonuclease
VKAPRRGSHTAEPPTIPIETSLGYRFSSPLLLERALMHSSAAREEGHGVVESQRLEFLGDAVLGFLVGEMIYHRAPNLAEGPMSRLRAALVQQATLAERARSLGLPAHIRLGRGEEASGGRSKPSIQSDIYESILGALYLDGGIEAARAFVEREFGPLLEREIGRGHEGPVHAEQGRRLSKKRGRGKAGPPPHGKRRAEPRRSAGRPKEAGACEPRVARARHARLPAPAPAPAVQPPEPRDPKTTLQEWLQGRGRPLPTYRLVATEGPDHARRYTVEVVVEGRGMGRGEGTSKRRAEARAALAALRRLEGSGRSERGAGPGAVEEVSSEGAARAGRGRRGSRRGRGR